MALGYLLRCNRIHNRGAKWWEGAFGCEVPAGLVVPGACVRVCVCAWCVCVVRGGGGEGASSNGRAATYSSRGVCTEGVGDATTGTYKDGMAVSPDRDNKMLHNTRNGENTRNPTPPPGTLGGGQASNVPSTAPAPL